VTTYNEADVIHYLSNAYLSLQNSNLNNDPLTSPLFWADIADGVTGATGASGIQGPTGVRGQSGIQGSSGQSGIQGPTGTTGVRGQSGIQGHTGIQGLTGPTGPTGVRGQSGIQGTTGYSISYTGGTNITITDTTNLINLDAYPVVEGVKGGFGNNASNFHLDCFENAGSIFLSNQVQRPVDLVGSRVTVDTNTMNINIPLIANTFSSFGDSYDPTQYGMLQIVRAATQPDVHHYISFVREGNFASGIGFRNGTNKMYITNDWGNNDPSGITLDTNKMGINNINPLNALDVIGNAKITGQVVQGMSCTLLNKDVAITVAQSSGLGNGTLSLGMGNGNVQNAVYFASKNESGVNVYGALQLSTTGSDDRRKHNEQPVVNAIESVMKLKPEVYDKTFDFKDKDFVGQLIDGTFTREAGLIAQDVYKIDEFKDYVVVGDENTSWDVNYNSVFTIGLKAIQELKIEKDELSIRNQQLETRVTELENKLNQILSMI
jgi:hypothetical protein